jgi:hypothetical protein
LNEQPLGTGHATIKTTAFKEFIKTVVVFGKLIKGIPISELIHTEKEGMRISIVEI